MVVLHLVLIHAERRWNRQHIQHISLPMTNLEWKYSSLALLLPLLRHQKTPWRSTSKVSTAMASTSWGLHAEPLTNIEQHVSPPNDKPKICSTSALLLSCAWPSEDTTIELRQGGVFQYFSKGKQRAKVEHFHSRLVFRQETCYVIFVEGSIFFSLYMTSRCTRYSSGYLVRSFSNWTGGKNHRNTDSRLGFLFLRRTKFNVSLCVFLSCDSVSSWWFASKDVPKRLSHSEEEKARGGCFQN